MRILCLTNLYPNPWQPARATFIRHQLRLLAERHEVRVIAPIAWTDEWRARRGGLAPLPAGRRTLCDGIVAEHPRYWFPPLALRRSYGRFFHASVAEAFRRALAEARPDVVFTPWAYPDGWAATRLAAAAGLPAALQVHGSDILLLDRHPDRKPGTLAALQAADGVISVSHAIADRLAALGIDRGKVRVIHDGVDEQRFHPGDRATARDRLGWPAEGTDVLFVGNLVSVKGLDTLLEALPLAAARRPDLRLRIVGAGPEARRLEALAARLGVAARVTFHGAVMHDALPDCYRAAHALALPSRSEGLPNVLMEASACGIPWVASAVGGVAELAERGPHFLVPPGRPEALADALVRAAELDASRFPLRTKPRSAAVAEAEEFLAETIARRAAAKGVA